MSKLLIGLAALSVLVLVTAGGIGTAGAGGGETGADGWLLGGTAQLAQDPENPANDVIKIDTTGCDPITGAGCTFGTVSRSVNTRVDKLDNMLEFKSWFRGGLSPKSCIGGSPRLQLAIDINGDGVSDGNAFGYFGASPDFVACPMETWLNEDLTGAGDIAITGGALFPSTGQTEPNEELEWDTTQFGGPFYNTWSEVEQFFATTYPTHLVCTVALVDDTFGAPTMSGVAYYDVISGGRATFEDRFDVAGRGFARGCGRLDDADGNGKGGDKDRDGDVDDKDGKFDKQRRERVNH
jgi:hypothetical protein